MQITSNVAVFNVPMIPARMEGSDFINSVRVGQAVFELNKLMTLLAVYADSDLHETQRLASLVRTPGRRYHRPLMSDAESILEVIATSGSVYIIDTLAMTWRRLRVDGAAHTRTDDGVFLGMRLKLGDRLILICPPIVPGADARVISSTPVPSITSLDREVADR